ncbi:MAG: pyridoxal phosphate-dependent aminotransferase [Candidatus Eremiobacteraeota bacterium]|nr:pyridoxal phosphate-dependent aminotransferase [Candidatus Eremiobacteraeota bacterium]
MNPRVQAISGSLIREIAAKRTHTSVDLGLGEPSLAPNPVHLQSGFAHVEKHGLRYTVNAGDANLRERIAAHYAYPNLSSADNVCVTTGSQEATYVVLKTLLDPAKDELLIVEPSFPSYAKMAALEGVATRRVAMAEGDDFAYDPERILAAVGPQTRVVVICSPCNPSARVISSASVRRISEGLERRGGAPVWVLHDEIYREQTFCGDAGYFADVYPHTVVTNSVSKSNALTGLRLGWALAPRDVAAGIVKTHAWVTSCADAFAQHVARSIFESGSLNEHSPWYAAQHAAVVTLLRDSGLRSIIPEGSFYACVALPKGMDSLTAAHTLADTHGVIAIPGIAFGECFDGWLRLSWVGPIADVREGLARIARFCESYREAEVSF